MATRLEKLRIRRTDHAIKASGLNEVYSRLTKEDEAIRYAIGAMQPIDPVYTQNTIEERDRVEKQLANGYLRVGLGVDFDYQGSVTNDTHIKAHSDVDLLTVEQRFCVIEPPNRPRAPYEGDTVANLRELREAAFLILKKAYPEAIVDGSGSKAINISGGSLRRKVDVIASDWWHTAEYMRERHKSFLGIEILDNEKGERVQNKPFLHNQRIEEKDIVTVGGLRKIIRLLKSLKYDSEDRIELSSYDIAGIAYNIFNDWLMFHPGQDLILLQRCQRYLHLLLSDRPYRESIEVPNEMRKIFCAEGSKEAGLQQLSTAMDALVSEVEQGLCRSFKKLAEARVYY